MAEVIESDVISKWGTRRGRWTPGEVRAAFVGAIGLRARQWRGHSVWHRRESTRLWLIGASLAVGDWIAYNASVLGRGANGSDWTVPAFLTDEAAPARELRYSAPDSGSEVLHWTKANSRPLCARRDDVTRVERQF
jgi:hypothetical protein